MIWGAGREGLAAHAELVRRGVAATFAVTGDGATSGGGLPAAVAVDAHAVARLEAADVVIKSPGVPRSSPVFLRLQAKLGMAVTSLTDLWLSANSHRVLAVTGTKGKSTTSALAHHLLTGIGRTASLVGNGGTPVTAGDHANAEFAVAEVSSYQAADLTTSPRVAVVTSLFPSTFPGMAASRYVADKLNLIAHGPEVVVVPSLQEDPRARCANGSAATCVSSIPLRSGCASLTTVSSGKGSVASAARRSRSRAVTTWSTWVLAMTAVSQLVDGTGSGVDLLAAAASFTPLAHRLERVPSPDGRTWVDDSLATAPEAVVAALETYPTQRVTLVLGGADRGLSFEPLLSYLSQRAPGADVSVIAVGPAGARWMSEGAPAVARSRLAVSFGQAMEWAGKDPTGSDVVLLSPGAPSFDEFTSFEERSAVFRAAAANSEKA